MTLAVWLVSSNITCKFGIKLTQVTFSLFKNVRHVHADCEDEELVNNYHQLKTTAGHSATTYQCPDCRQNRQYSGLEMETQTVDTDGKFVRILIFPDFLATFGLVNCHHLFL